jgi:ABC-type Fe3+ transport system permease subunit
MNVFLIITAVFLAIGMLYFFAKTIYISTANFYEIENDPKKFLVNTLKISVYMALGGVCFSFALALILTIYDVDFLGLLGCLVPLMIFLSIIYGLGYFGRAKFTANLNKRLNKS